MHRLNVAIYRLDLSLLGCMSRLVWFGYRNRGQRQCIAILCGFIFEDQLQPHRNRHRGRFDHEPHLITAILANGETHPFIDDGSFMFTLLAAKSESGQREVRRGVESIVQDDFRRALAAAWF